MKRLSTRERLLEEVLALRGALAMIADAPSLEEAHISAADALIRSEKKMRPSAIRDEWAQPDQREDALEAAARRREEMYAERAARRLTRRIAIGSNGRNRDRLESTPAPIEAWKGGADVARR